jgi:hypothetical protein
MAISRDQLNLELVPGLNTLFALEYKGYEKQYEPIFETESSVRAFEEEVALTGFGTAPTKSEGAGVTYDQAGEAYVARYTHETVALAFALTEEAMEDNLYEKIATRYTKALARSMAYTKNVKGAAVLNNAFDSNYTGGDTKELIATDHPLAGGGTWANEPTTAADLNETSLENACIDISNFTDEKGLLIALNVKGLVIPTQLRFVAERVLKSTGRVGTTDNDLNAIKSTSAIPGGYAINNFLTDVDAWFVRTDCPDGLKHFQRAPISHKMEGDFETGNLRYKCRERYSFGWSNPRTIYGSPGA